MKKKREKKIKKEPKKGLNPTLKTILLLLVITITIVIITTSLPLFKVEKQLPIEKKVKETKMETKEMRIRNPAVAGIFYPSQPQILASQIDKYLSQAKKKPFKKIRGIVAPHAGYRYSGPIAASAYAQLINKKYKTVIILGPSHHLPLRGASIPKVTHYQTPLGPVRLSEKAEKLLNSKIIRNIEGAHLREHSIEIQLPFLQRVLGDFELVPIVTGRVDPEQLAKTLQPHLDDETLVVASSDLSHYLSYEEAVAKDKHCIEAIPNLDFEEMELCEACGKIPILTLMHLARMGGWRGELLDYRNSGDTQGNKERVVGYTAIIFYEATKTGGTGGEMLNKDEQDYLLKLSRETLERYVKDGEVLRPDPREVPPKTREIRGCFVTLNKDGRLRGCIGHITPQKPLYQCVVENTINAAVHDHRFKPVEPGELEEIEIEISVLTPPKPLLFSSPDQLLEKLVPFRDGVVIRMGFHQATYLPQVWEQLPEKKEFLSHLCLKAGLNPDCWRNKNLEVFTYQAQVFHERRDKT